MEDINLIRKIAWSFHQTTKVDFEELVSEGIYQYYECLKYFDHERGVKRSTLLYRYVHNRLVTFTKIEQRYVLGCFINPVTNPTPFFELADEFSGDTKFILNLIMDYKQDFAGIPGKTARGRLVKSLRYQGWSWSRIWDGIRNFKSTLNENPNLCIIY